MAAPRLTTETQRHKGCTEKEGVDVGAKVMNSQINQLTHEIIGASIEVHRNLGAGAARISIPKMFASRIVT